MKTATTPQKVIKKDPSIQNRSTKKSTELATRAGIIPKKSNTITVDVEVLPDDKKIFPICDAHELKRMDKFMAESKTYDLPKLTTKIAAYVEEIDEAVGDVISAAGSALMNAWYCGVCLIQAKEQIPHGDFKNWFDENFSIPKFSMRTAQRYMKIAMKNPKLEDLNDLKPGLRQAYIACGILPEVPEKENAETKESGKVAQDRLLKSVTGIRNKLDRFSARKIRLNQQTRDALLKEKSEIDRLFNDLIA